MIKAEGQLSTSVECQTCQQLAGSRHHAVAVDTEVCVQQCHFTQVFSQVLSMTIIRCCYAQHLDVV